MNKGLNISCLYVVMLFLREHSCFTKKDAFRRFSFKTVYLTVTNETLADWNCLFMRAPRLKGERESAREPSVTIDQKSFRRYSLTVDQYMLSSCYSQSWASTQKMHPVMPSDVRGWKNFHRRWKRSILLQLRWSVTAEYSYNKRFNIRWICWGPFKGLSRAV